MPTIYHLARMGVLSMKQSLQTLPPDAEQAEHWARGFSEALDVLDTLAHGTQSSGSRDPEVKALLEEARMQISQYATISWIQHSPRIVAGLEDGLLKIAAIREQYAYLQSGTHSPAPLPTAGAQSLPSSSQQSNLSLGRHSEGHTSPSPGGSTQRDLRRTLQQVPIPATVTPVQQSPLNSVPPSPSQSPLHAPPQLPSRASLAPPSPARSPLRAPSQLPSQTLSAASSAVNVAPGVTMEHSAGPLTQTISATSGLMSVSSVAAPGPPLDASMSPLPPVGDTEQTPLVRDHMRTLRRVSATSVASVWYTEMSLAQSQAKAADERFKFAENMYLAALKDISTSTSSNEEEPQAKRARTVKTKAKERGRGKAKAKAKARVPTGTDLEDVQSGTRCGDTHDDGNRRLSAVTHTAVRAAVATSTAQHSQSQHNAAQPATRAACRAKTRPRDQRGGLGRHGHGCTATHEAKNRVTNLIGARRPQESVQDDVRARHYATCMHHPEPAGLVNRDLRHLITVLEKPQNLHSHHGSTSSGTLSGTSAIHTDTHSAVLPAPVLTPIARLRCFSTSHTPRQMADRLYTLTRDGLLHMRAELITLPENGEGAEDWARRFSESLNAIESAANGAAGKGLRDAQVSALLREIRQKLQPFFTATWIDHSPDLVAGMEESLQTIATIRATASQSSAHQSAAQEKTRPTSPQNVLNLDSPPDDDFADSGEQHPPLSRALKPITIIIPPRRTAPSLESPTMSDTLQRSSSKHSRSSAGSIDEQFSVRCEECRKARRKCLPSAVPNQCTRCDVKGIKCIPVILKAPRGAKTSGAVAPSMSSPGGPSPSPSVMVMEQQQSPRNPPPIRNELEASTLALFWGDQYARAKADVVAAENRRYIARMNYITALESLLPYRRLDEHEPTKRPKREGDSKGKGKQKATTVEEDNVEEDDVMGSDVEMHEGGGRSRNA
ncbi:hypothetical protein EDB85DRAFT_1893715 [Lactarius pseudohatsudake]|nr:hypothetical protein EDB85DRAFT_1893715 [Lactarius pseudohatsudake]